MEPKKRLDHVQQLVRWQQPHVLDVAQQLDVQLTTHEPNVGQRAFRHRKRDSGPEAAVGCSSFFLCEEAMLGPAFSQVDGKLACPKCTAHLGSYTWSGMQCSCGAWVAPAFQVVKSKVDEVRIKTR